MSLDCYRKDYILPFIDYGEFIDVAIELGKYKVKVQGFFAKQRDENSSIMMKNISLNIVE